MVTACAIFLFSFDPEIFSMKSCSRSIQLHDKLWGFNKKFSKMAFFQWAMFHWNFPINSSLRMLLHLFKPQQFWYLLTTWSLNFYYFFFLIAGLLMLVMGKQRSIINKGMAFFSPKILDTKKSLPSDISLSFVVDNLIRSTQRKKRTKVCTKRVIK